MSGSILVTGATSGIGLATAHALARRGWPLILHGRDLDKARRAAEQILAAIPSADVTPVSADFADLAAVERLASSVAQMPLVTIVHNAAAANYAGARSAQGHELTFAVGQLSPWVLTMRLLSTLKQQPTSSVVWMSSQSHAAARLAPMEIAAAEPESAEDAYARTKLANLATHFALSARWKGTAIQSVAFDPGPTETPLMATLRANNQGLKGWMLRRIVPLFSRTAERVAEDLAWTIEQSQNAISQGAYFGIGQKPVRAASSARDVQRGAAVLAACESITGVSNVTKAIKKEQTL
jgi:NAD(P)-dependent dehydrogenase (short-subunit alcohol dehydrogenase family)